MRIEGAVVHTSDEESDAYYASRPLDSRIGAWASPQSQVIGGRGVLVAQAARYAAQFALHPPRPPHWGGYRLVPDRWEFWQGRKSRLHDRLRFVRQPGPVAVHRSSLEEVWCGSTRRRRWPDPTRGPA